jgi:hypothetical protein
MNYYTYIYIDPIRNIPRYVGYGHGNRSHKHLNKTGNKSFAGWIRKLKEKSLIPIIIKEEVRSKEEAKLLEIFWISIYGRIDNKTGCLFNHTNGGDGGDTVLGADPIDIKIRYEKRRVSLDNRTDEEQQKSRNKASAAMKEAWLENKEPWSQNIKRGISEKRDKIKHSNAISNGWKNRTEEEKKQTQKIKSESRKLAWRDEEKRENLLNGTRSISIRIKIIDSNGNEYIADSLASWCRENKESYSVLWNILHNRSPKENKYKRSKYQDWKIIRI